MLVRPPVPTVPPASDSVHTKDCLSSDRTTVWIFPQAPATATDTIGQAWKSRSFSSYFDLSQAWQPVHNLPPPHSVIQ